jgi:hypothetical protein
MLYEQQYALCVLCRMVCDDRRGHGGTDLDVRHRDTNELGGLVVVVAVPQLHASKISAPVLQKTLTVPPVTCNVAPVGLPTTAWST